MRVCLSLISFFQDRSLVVMIGWAPTELPLPIMFSLCGDISSLATTIHSLAAMIEGWERAKALNFQILEQQKRIIATLFTVSCSRVASLYICDLFDRKATARKDINRHSVSLAAARPRSRNIMATSEPVSATFRSLTDGGSNLTSQNSAAILTWKVSGAN